jgi:hypothetical protein
MRPVIVSNGVPYSPNDPAQYAGEGEGRKKGRKEIKDERKKNRKQVELHQRRHFICNVHM